MHQRCANASGLYTHYLLCNLTAQVPVVFSGESQNQRRGVGRVAFTVCSDFHGQKYCRWLSPWMTILGFLASFCNFPAEEKNSCMFLGINVYFKSQNYVGIKAFLLEKNPQISLYQAGAWLCSGWRSCWNKGRLVFLLGGGRQERFHEMEESRGKKVKPSSQFASCNLWSVAVCKQYRSSVIRCTCSLSVVRSKQALYIQHNVFRFLLPKYLFFIYIALRPWGLSSGREKIQFSYCTMHFIPSCCIKFIPIWSGVCEYKSFKFICFCCCGNCLTNWIPKCLSLFQSYDKGHTFLAAGVWNGGGGGGGPVKMTCSQSPVHSLSSGTFGNWWGGRQRLWRSQNYL